MKGIKLIGLSGKAGSGKDWLGRTVLEPAGWSKFALAWPMKHEAMGHGFSYREVHYDKPEPVRRWLQHRGTEDGWHKYGEEYWLRIADGWMRTLSETYGVRRFYVPDIRFPHEVAWIKRHGGAVIRLVGRGGLHGDAAEHESETALDDYRGWDYVLSNGQGATAEQHARSLAGLLRSLECGAITSQLVCD